MKYVAFQAVMLSAVLVHFSTETAFAQQAVLYDFTATWCGPCQQVAPIVHKLQREGLPIQQVDIDKNPKLAKQFRVSSIPAFVLVVNGKEVKRILGGQTSEQDLRRLVAMIPKSKPNQQSVLASNQQKNRNSQQRRNSGYETPVLGSPSAFPTSFEKKQSNQPQQYANANQTAPPMPNVSAQQPIQKTAPAFANSRNNPPVNSLANNRRTKETPIIRGQLDESSNVTKPTPHIDSSAANVRIRIKDENGINYGSGTIIHSTPGVSYILTCGHIFRHLTESSKVDVDIFTGDRFESYLGKVEKYDLDADVGLISIPTDGVLPVARLAISGSQLPKGESVISVGCSGGQPPTTQNLSVTALNRYTGPDNVECTGVPVQGRSGGGLFNLENEVVGVCIAADPKEKRGLYAGLKPILDLVASCGLESIVRKPEPISQPVESLIAANSNNPFGVPMLEPPAAVPAGSPVGFNANNNAPLSSNVNPTSQQPQISQMDNSLQFANGAKLTIVIESPDAPGQTRVVIIPFATARLIADLTGELNKTQNVSAHRRMISQASKPSFSPRNARSVIPVKHVNPIRTVSREEDRSMTMPTGFSAAQPYRRVHR
jgi:thiol-disulfide isomerase/thioredoxin